MNDNEYMRMHFAVNQGDRYRINEIFFNIIKEKKFTKEHAGVLRFLLSHGANINIKDYKGNNTLYESVKQKNIEKINFLLSKQININEKNNNRQTVIHLLSNLMPSKKKIIFDKHWPLIKISSKGHIIKTNSPNKILKILIKNQVNLNIQDNNGNTALHLFIQQEKPELIVQLLLEAVPLDIKNNNNETATNLINQNPNLKNQLESELYQIYEAETKPLLTSVNAWEKEIKKITTKTQYLVDVKELLLRQLGFYDMRKKFSNAFKMIQTESYQNQLNLIRQKNEEEITEKQFDKAIEIEQDTTDFLTEITKLSDNLPAQEQAIKSLNNFKIKEYEKNQISSERLTKVESEMLEIQFSN